MCVGFHWTWPLNDHLYPPNNTVNTEKWCWVLLVEVTKP